MKAIVTLSVHFKLFVLTEVSPGQDQKELLSLCSGHQHNPTLSQEGCGGSRTTLWGPEPQGRKATSDPSLAYTPSGPSMSLSFLIVPLSFIKVRKDLI